MAKVQRTLHCKKAILGQPIGNLQDALIAALAKKPQAKQRQETVGAGNPPRYRVIGQHFAFKKALVGVLMAYEPGSKAASLVNDPSATQLTIDHFSAPPAPDGKTREWLEGMLYFLVLENHLVFIQSMSVRHEQLEEHLGWLLAHDPKKPVIVTLADQPPTHVANLIQKNHVKSLVVGGALMAPASNTTEVVQKDTFKVEGRLLDAVKAMLDTDKQGFKWHDGLDGNLEAKLQLTFRRSTTDSAQRLLDNLAVAFRKAEGVDTELILANGDRITQDELRLVSKRGIEAKDGVLNATAAFDEMYNWLNSLANSGQL